MNILQTIVEEKNREVERLPQRSISVETLQAAMQARGERRDFAQALLQPKRGSVALIAEVKRASPSAGVICPNFDPVRIAQQYETAGASCLSVLTDEKFFEGSLQHLRRIRAAVTLPLLRKDFIIDERQILEAIEWGADAILLITAILDASELRRFHELAIGAGLAALVEVHDESELERALAARARLVGINNRDLKTFQADLGNTERLAARALSSGSTVDRGAGPILVAESGIHTATDVQRVARAGARAILVGEFLMRGPDIGSKVDELLGPRRT